MVRIQNSTVFPVETLLWENVEGKPNLTVVVKATFRIEKGKPITAEEPIPILSADEPYSDDPGAPVRFESDLVPFKPVADIVLVGRAHAPRGRPVSQLDTTVQVGDLKKTIRVVGDRKWWFPTRLVGQPEISPPAPFVNMDLTYERAYGGIDSVSAYYCEENLVGTGYVGTKSKDAVHEMKLPNLEDPKDLIRSWDSRPRPKGFGFYGRGWMPRLGYAGTYDDKHRKERAPLLPLDFSYRVYNGAHPDLQIEGYLSGDEMVELSNVSPEPVLRFRLPGVRPTIIVARWTVSPEIWLDQRVEEDPEATLDQVPVVEEPAQAVLDTLVFIPDDMIFYEVFRAVVPLTKLDEPEIARIKVTT